MEDEALSLPISKNKVTTSQDRSDAGVRHVNLMKRVETKEATTSRGAEGSGPVVAGARWSVVALVSEVGGNVGMATSCHVQILGNMKGKPRRF